MKKIKFTLLVLACLLIITSCKEQKKFTATASERELYTKAYTYLKNIRSNIAEKEIEPSIKEMLTNAADEIVKFGDVDNLEKTIPYDYFKQSLQKAQEFVSQFSHDSVDEKSIEFKQAEVKYKSVQSKLKVLKPNQLEKNIDAAQIEPAAKNSFLFMAEQIKKYDLSFFLKKTLVPFKDLDKTLENMSQLIGSTDIIKQLQELEGMLNELK